jgi:lysophospholipase L1-like esterase
LLQGRWVRRVTPVLPEAPGPREGRAGEGPPLRLLILGDSAAAGVGAPAQAEALAGQLASRLAPRFDLRWTLVARTGDTTRDALQTLATMPGERFDVVVTSLGVNDVTSGRSPTRWMADQARLVEVLRQHFGARQILLSALPPMHRFPALPQPLRAYLGAQARRYNVALQAFAATRTKAAPGYRWIWIGDAGAHGVKTGFIPVHQVYAAWAAQLAALDRGPCRSARAHRRRGLIPWVNPSGARGAASPEWQRPCTFPCPRSPGACR